MALQVARADNFVSRLQEELKQCPALAGRKIETINLGVEGFTIDQQFLVLRDYGLSLSPNFVLLQSNSALEFNPSSNFSPHIVMRNNGVSVNRTYAEMPGFKARASGAAALVSTAKRL